MRWYTKYFFILITCNILVSMVSSTGLFIVNNDNSASSLFTNKIQNPNDNIDESFNESQDIPADYFGLSSTFGAVKFILDITIFAPLITNELLKNINLPVLNPIWDLITILSYMAYVFFIYAIVRGFEL
ncbi:hypothetical protein J3E07_001652 [Methanococcus voltae]|uniref:Uncharacterized protein n=1 Tax=Methanococcus voltae TaxID=2188 RepID=A0A8J7RJT8_METVO|nr:hypothetical protein [Methanococcus voltae]MBP2202211.1 hypothetical protein [Methanococcus voltae]